MQRWTRRVPRTMASRRSRKNSTIKCASSVLRYALSGAPLFLLFRCPYTLRSFGGQWTQLTPFDQTHSPIHPTYSSIQKEHSFYVADYGLHGRPTGGDGGPKDSRQRHPTQPGFILSISFTLLLFPHRPPPYSLLSLSNIFYSFLFL